MSGIAGERVSCPSQNSRGSCINPAQWQAAFPLLSQGRGISERTLGTGGFSPLPHQFKAFALDGGKKNPRSEQGFVSVCCEEDSLWVPYLSQSFSRTSSRKELASKHRLPLCLEVPDCLASSHSVLRILQNFSCFLWLLLWQPPLPSVLFQS